MVGKNIYYGSQWDQKATKATPLLGIIHVVVVYCRVRSIYWHFLVLQLDFANHVQKS